MSVWDTQYPEHVAVRRSVNGGLVHVCFSVTPGITEASQYSFGNFRKLSFMTLLCPFNLLIRFEATILH